MAIGDTTRKMRERPLVQVKKSFTEEEVFGRGQASPYPLKDIGRIASDDSFVRPTIIGFQNGGVLHIDGRILQAWTSPNGIMTIDREILPARKVAAFKNLNPGTAWIWVKGQKIPSTKQQRESLEREHARTEAGRQQQQAADQQAAPSRTRKVASAAGRLALKGAVGGAKFAGRTALRGTVGAVSHAAALPFTAVAAFGSTKWNEAFAKLPGRKKPFQIKSGPMDIQKGVAGVFSKGIYGLGRGTLGAGRMTGRLGQKLLSRNDQIISTDPAIGGSSSGLRPSQIMGEPFPQKEHTWNNKRSAGDRAIMNLSKNLEGAFRTMFDKLDAIKASVDTGFAGMKEAVKDNEWDSADPHKLARVEAEREAKVVQGTEQFGPEKEKKKGLIASILGAITGNIGKWAATLAGTLSGALLAAFVKGPVSLLKKVWNTAADAARNARTRVTNLGQSVRNTIRSMFTRLSDNFNRNFVKNSPQAIEAREKIARQQIWDANQKKLAAEKEARRLKALNQPRGPKGEFIKQSPRSMIPAEVLDGKPKIKTPQMNSPRSSIPAETLDGKAPQKVNVPTAGSGGGFLSRLMKTAILPAIAYELGTHGIEYGLNKFDEHVLGREPTEMRSLMEKLGDSLDSLSELAQSFGREKTENDGNNDYIEKLEERLNGNLTDSMRSKIEDKIRRLRGEDTLTPKVSEDLQNKMKRIEDNIAPRAPVIVPVPVPTPSEPSQSTFPTAGPMASNKSGGGVGSATSTASNMLEFKLFGLNQSMIG